MQQLTKENLQQFIKDYPTPFSSLTDEPYQQAYLDGIKDVLADLEATFLWELKIKEVDISALDETTKESLMRGIAQANRGGLTTLDSYLSEEGIIDEVIQVAKVNLANMSSIKDWEDHLKIS